MNSSQHDDGYAWTWEPAAGALAATTLLACLALQAGRSLALAVAGTGWHWPPSAALITSTAAILTGNLAAGLDNIAADAAEPVVAWITSGILFAAAMIGTAMLAARWAAMRRHKGMASTSHAEHLLGLGRLRATRAVIRPDLYRKHRS